MPKLSMQPYIESNIEAAIKELKEARAAVKRGSIVGAARALSYAVSYAAEANRRIVANLGDK